MRFTRVATALPPDGGLNRMKGWRYPRVARLEF
jgi:hypothetical protein